MSGSIYPSSRTINGILCLPMKSSGRACRGISLAQLLQRMARIQASDWKGQRLAVVAGGLTRRWSRLAIASCGMVRLLAASCSTFSFAQGVAGGSREWPPLKLGEGSGQPPD